MKQTVVTAQYLQIALDLASRIAGGELKEGSKIYGRSMMASEYGVSPKPSAALCACFRYEGGGRQAPKRGRCAFC